MSSLPPSDYRLRDPHHTTMPYHCSYCQRHNRIPHTNPRQHRPTHLVLPQSTPTNIPHLSRPPHLTPQKIPPHLVRDCTPPYPHIHHTTRKTSVPLPTLRRTIPTIIKKKKKKNTSHTAPDPTRRPHQSLRSESPLPNRDHKELETLSHDFTKKKKIHQT